MKIIDLRSDTFTLPSDEMRKAIAQAEVGDDVFQEDPSVNSLQQKAADLMGKEAGLFVPSGTMGNLVSILTHCSRGSEVILGNKSHTFIYEAGGISALGGIHSHQLKNQENGTLLLDEIKSAIRSDNVHFPRTALISLENTHNMCFGTPLSLEYMSAVSGIARENNLKLHVDGARIFNAAVALGVPVNKLAEMADSVTFSLSKGLAAPVGSVVCGSGEFISEARRNRKILGGGMRQAGILAAAGIFTLNQGLDQIKKDHRNARILAEGIADLPGLSIVLKNVSTNIVFVETTGDNYKPTELVALMEKEGIKFLATGPNRMRFVTHYGIEQEDVERTVEEFTRLLRQAQ
ncbi:MAG: low-specificity L-threonine aldolase [FCB group bacterium]|nr:low-specificity L-threonine aldolase [FCB group bacterium]